MNGDPPMSLSHGTEARGLNLLVETFKTPMVRNRSYSPLCGPPLTPLVMCDFHSLKWRNFVDAVLPCPHFLGCFP